MLLLAAVAIAPLALMSGIALQALLDQQREQTESSTLDLSRALATGVDTELRLTVTALQTLAATEPLTIDAAGDIATSTRLAQRVLAVRPEWRALALAGPSGHVLFSTGYPLRDPQPAIDDPESFAAVVRTGAPAIGSLARDAGGDYGVAVRVPIIADGELRFVLTAVLKPDAVLEVIRRQRVPADWIVSVFDAKHVRVARSRDHAKYLGKAPSPSLLAMLSRQPAEAVGFAETVEGERTVTAATRLPMNWTVVIGVPASLATNALQHSAIAYGGGILLSLGIGSLAAFLVARSIARPIARLRDAALALGAGRPPPGNPAGMVEIEAVGQALIESAHRRERGEAERETLLAAERRARAAAEGARHRLELMASAGALLSRSLEEQTTLEAIGSVVVPDIADICRIDLLDRDGVLQRKLTHHRDPVRAREIASLVQQGQVSIETPGSFPWAIATGQTYLGNFDSPEGFGIVDPAFREFARSTGMRALCVTPLVARGRMIGALGALQAESGRQFSDEDAVLIGELAQRAALALDNVRLYTEANAALHEAEVANRAKDEFLAMLGHELRNPLAPIVTSLELMARRDGVAGAPERRIIERQVAHLSRLVDDLLDVSRIASGKVQLAPEHVDLRRVVTRALELAQPALQPRAKPPEVSLPDQPAWVTGDPMRLAQVVSNLLTNAVKFSRSTDPIGIELKCVDHSVVLTVSDEGIGITPDLLPHVFERFVQGGQALQRAAGGLGLGLAIARALVQLHGGTIRAESDGPGRGSRFTVTLPEAPAQPSTSPSPEARAGQRRRGAKILVVDDNADAAESLAQLLRFEGHDVRSAGSGEEALERIGEFIPDVALLDIGLPKMDGYELARTLRADPRLRSTRLIALTGYGRAPDRKRALEAGFDEHMVKPVDIESLLTRLDELLSDRRGTTS